MARDVEISVYQYDMNVAVKAYKTASSMTSNSKVLLALFEAGIVESSFKNLSYGDRDSVGFLQQRPSQGWGTKSQCMDVAHATREFVKRALPLAGKYKTAGQLAQAVQRSAFPLKYDQVENQAKKLLEKVSKGDYILTGDDKEEGFIEKWINKSLDTVFESLTGLGLYGALIVLIFVSLGIVYNTKKKGV